jgi:hypothetical protein
MDRSLGVDGIQYMVSVHGMPWTICASVDSTNNASDWYRDTTIWKIQGELRRFERRLLTTNSPTKSFAGNGQNFLIREFKLRVQTSNGKRQETEKTFTLYKVINGKWTCYFKAVMYDDYFEIRTRRWSEEVNQKFCQQNSTVPFARKREA